MRMLRATVDGVCYVWFCHETALPLWGKGDTYEAAKDDLMAKLLA